MMKEWRLTTTREETTMKHFMRHWYDIGAILVVPVLVWAWLGNWSTVQFILLLNFVVILIHQFEEYRLPGGETWITNEVFQPKGGPVDRYPLNQLNATFINVLAWLFYLVPVFFPDLVWLGLAPALFGAPGQLVVHGVITNRKLKTIYNPGLAAVFFGHLPLTIWYLVEVYQRAMITGWDWLFAVIYLVFFMGIIMMRIGYGVMSSQDSRHPFTPAELNRWNRDQRLQNAGIIPLPLHPDENP